MAALMEISTQKVGNIFKKEIGKTPLKLFISIQFASSVAEIVKW